MLHIVDIRNEVFYDRSTSIFFVGRRRLFFSFKVVRQVMKVYDTTDFILRKKRTIVVLTVENRVEEGIVALSVEE